MGAAQSSEGSLVEQAPTSAAPGPSKLTVEALAKHASEESDEDLEESFASWRSAASGAPSQVASHRTSQEGDDASLGSMTPLSGGTRSSAQWLDQRPSADTPLPDSGGAAAGNTPAYKGSSLATSEPGAAGPRHSRSSEIRASSDSNPFRRSSVDGDPAARLSGDGTASVYSAAGSGRSSFALERASVEANRASLEAFQEAFATGPLMPAAKPSQRLAAPVAAAAPITAGPAPLTFNQLVHAAQLPSSLREKYARLCVLPPNTPAPTSVLGKLWQADALDVKASLAALAAKGILNVAQLPDGRVWCLPQAQQLALVQAACRELAPQYHRLLLDAYCSSLLPSIMEEQEAAMGGGPAAALQQQHLQQAQQWQYHNQPPPPCAQQQYAYQQQQLLPQRLQDIQDDGYILINIGHHLTAAGRHQQLRQLLLDPDWLRRKLVAAGTTAVVADFRRYLLLHNCADMKLVLEAFQLSAAQAVAYPLAPGLLRCLMVGRLATAPVSPGLQAWLAEQQRRIYDDSRQSLLSGLPRCLVPLTPSLDQAGGLQRLALRGHSGAVTKVLLTPSGTDAVSASADGTARVWDLDIGDCVLLLEGHAGPITDMAITSDGSLVLTCSTDGTARAFEMERGTCLRVLAGHTAAINALAMDPWARFVVTASTDGTARVWDLSSARSVHTLKTSSTPDQGGVLAVALSPCTRFAIVGCANNKAQMFDVISGQCMGVMAGHTNWVNLVRFLPDGKKAVTASHDGTARVWDLHTGTCRHVLQGHTGRINSLVVSADAKWCATASEDCTARIWDLRRGHCRRVLTGHKAWVSDVAVSPANDKLVTTSGDGTVLAYSLESGDMLCLLEGHSAAVHSAVVTRKGRFAVSVSEDATVRVWDFAATLVQPPSYHEGRVYCVSGSSAGRVVATCGEDCNARLWDSERGTFKGLLHRHKVPIRWAAFSADGSQLVTASPDRTVLLWDAASLSVVREVPVSEGSRIRSFAASADLGRAIICKWDSTVVVMDLQTGERMCTLQRWGERDSTTGHTSAVNQVLMTSDGLTLVTVSKDCTARVWDATNGTCRHVLAGHTDSVLGGCINTAARLLATFSFDDSVRLWALDTGLCINTVKLPDTAQYVAISPDGWKVAVALSNASLCVFDVEDRQVGKPWEFHSSEITGLEFSADGAELMSCSLDASVCVWDAATGAQTGLFVGDCGFTCCWYDSVVDQLAVGTDRGIVHALDLGLQPRVLAPAAFKAPAVALAAAPQLPSSAAGAGAGLAVAVAAAEQGSQPGGTSSRGSGASTAQPPTPAGTEGGGAAAPAGPPLPTASDMDIDGQVAVQSGTTLSSKDQDRVAS